MHQPTPPSGNRKRIPRRIMEMVFRAGAFDVFHTLPPRRLTVLNYHRVEDLYKPGFDTFKPNVSATIEDFAVQMDYVIQRFNVVSIAEVLAWLRGESELPKHALLITFDDGYFDNLTNAAPILKARDLPALIFLTTNYIDQARPFYWDLVAYCFHHTQRDVAELPLAGLKSWSDDEGREEVVQTWCEQLKWIPDAEKWGHLEKLPEILDISIPSDAFAGLTLTWEQVRELVAQGIDMGSHTMNHPILTRVSLARAKEELVGSKERIEDEIGQPVMSFAYPNGLAPDFNLEIETLAQDAGYEAGFTLLPGPSSYAEVRRSPMEIRRIFIGYKDSLPRFAAKVSGLHRFIGRG